MSTALRTGVSNGTDLSMPPGCGLWERGGSPAESLDSSRTCRPAPPSLSSRAACEVNRNSAS